MLRLDPGAPPGERPEETPGQFSPLALAFLGDGVYELLAREYLLSLGNAPVGRLHSRTVELVSAAAQSAAYELLAPLLTEEEAAVYRRGRNAHAAHAPRHTGLSDYRRATGVEALFGWLYLTGRVERAGELFGVILAGRGEE